LITSLLEAGLPQDAPVGPLGQVVRGLARDSDLAGLGRVLELAMAPLLGNLDPTVVHQPPDHVLDLHALPRRYCSRSVIVSEAPARSKRNISLNDSGEVRARGRQQGGSFPFS